MSLRYFGTSHVGLRRKNNQDCICFLENKDHALLAVVCDGIGGGLAGDVASHIAIDHMKESFLKMTPCHNDVEVKHWLQNTIQEANDQIFLQSTKNEEQKGMGTTMVGILKYDASTYIFNVGDSRTYGLYKDDFLALTEDHSYVADMLKKGELSEAEAAVHPNRNMLTNALGIWNTVRIDINKIKNDYLSLLICSDGLHGYVSENTIRKILESNASVENKVQALIDQSLLAGGYDNVSVIIIEKDGETSE